MAQAVQPRRRNTVGHHQLKRADELAEGLAGGAGANAARTVEGKQRLGIDDRAIAVSTLQLLLKQRGDPRSVERDGSCRNMLRSELCCVGSPRAR